MHFNYFAIIFFNKSHEHAFEQTYIPFTEECYVPSLAEILR